MQGKPCDSVRWHSVSLSSKGRKSDSQSDNAMSGFAGDTMTPSSKGRKLGFQPENTMSGFVGVTINKYAPKALK